MAPYTHIFLFACMSLIEILCLPDGAPDKVCHTMLPFHGGGIKPSNTIAPFLIETSSLMISGDQTLGITVMGSPRGFPFSGLMVQARNADPPYETIGKFTLSRETNAKLMNCGSTINNTVTHRNTISKSSLILEWVPPVDFLGQVIFNGTVAQTYDTFWVGILSEPVRVMKRGGTLNNIDKTTKRPVYTITKPTYIPYPESATLPSKRKDPFYTDCGVSKTCFGFPDNCLKDQSCKFLSRISVRGDIFEFELISKSNSSTYIALGLSEDGKMGNDLVTECFEQGGEVHFHSSYTSGPPNYGTSRSIVRQNSARIIESSLNDGRVYCKIQRDIVTEIEKEVFDLAKKKYHILLAMGSSVKENGVGYHDLGRIPSALSINLAEVQDVHGSSNVLLRLHGAMMIIAWIGTSSLGIILARYFKRTWVGHQSCGKDKWFAWHRICMITTWSLTICAFVIIFIEIRGWSAERNPHAVLGLTTTMLCFAQFFYGLFRPSPTSKKRPLFNWLHWFTGNLAQILAFITVFFSVKLAKAELPKWMDLILVNFVAFHVVAHLIFSVTACFSDRSSEHRNNAFQMENMSGTRNEVKIDMIDAPYSRIRKLLLIAYTILLCVFVLILVLIVFLAPIDRTFEDIKSSLSS